MSPNWVRATDLDGLMSKGRTVVKLDGKQIALFSIDSNNGKTPEIRACNNRCPHEGYPLVEGTIAADRQDGACMLTCNWHNWKFDLNGGETAVGGDSLRLYPVKIDGNEVLVDVADPPPEQLIAKALDSIEDAMPRHEYDRIAREIARLKKAGGDPTAAVARAVSYSHDRFEYGMTHAFAAAADWIGMGDRLAKSDAETLAPYVEVIGHMAWDAMRGTRYPFTDKVFDYDAGSLVRAIAAEDEETAITLINGALDAGHDMEELRGPLAKAALAHYQDFGHAIIYVYKVYELARQLDVDVLRPLLHCLVRSLIYASREDLIPEFKAYGPAIKRWPEDGDADPAPASDYTTLSVAKVLKKIGDSARHGPALYPILLEAAAQQFLQYRVEMDHRTGNSVSDNIGWLDFTHAVTFSNAGRWAAEHDASLWPAVLLQMGCFLGRNAGYLDADVTVSDWDVGKEPETYLDEVMHSLFDHSFPEYIVSCHYVKTACAMREEIKHDPTAGHGRVMVAALNRMLAHPIKRKQLLRTATQSLDFVAREG